MAKLPRSIFISGVGWVRSKLLEFSDNYLHKPTPTDPCVGVALWNENRSRSGNLRSRLQQTITNLSMPN